jgi:hypothetical protein
MVGTINTPKPAHWTHKSYSNQLYIKCNTFDAFKAIYTPHSIDLSLRDLVASAFECCKFLFSWFGFSFSPSLPIIIIVNWSKRLCFFVWRSLRDFVYPRSEENWIGLHDRLREGKGWKRPVLSGHLNGDMCSLERILEKEIVVFFVLDHLLVICFFLSPLSCSLACDRFHIKSSWLPK